MELRHLRYFVAIADTGTMARAAEVVFVTQSTLSHQLTQLEAELGIPLFERVGRNLRLSDAGREFLGHARGVLGQVEEGKKAIMQAQQLSTGTLKVGVIHSFLTRLIPEVAAAFMRKYPGVKLEIRELTGLDIEAQVADGALDLGVAFFPSSTDLVMGERLFDDNLVLAMPAAHPLAERKSLKFNQLEGVPLAMLGKRFATRRMLDAHFQRAGISPHIVVEIDSVDALQKIVEMGVASAFLPGRFTRRPARVRLVEVTDPKPARAGGLIWRKSSYRSKASLAFSDLLVQALHANPT